MSGFMRGFLAGWVTLTLVLDWVFPAQAEQSRYVWFETREEQIASASGEMVAAFKAAGLNGVVVPAIVEGRSWYTSQLLPNSATATVGLEAARLAKANGLGLAVYIQTFIQAGDANAPNHLIQEHKDWLSSDWKGIPMERLLSGTLPEPSTLDGFFLDPGLPRVREFLLALTMEVVQALNPDWVILDHVRYPLPSPWAIQGLPHDQPYGFHPVPRKAFEKDSGVDPAALVQDSSRSMSALGGDEAARLRGDWNRRRLESVSTFVRSVREQLKSSHPSCRLAVVGYPDPVRARGELLQDWPQWIRSSLVDAVILPDNVPEKSTTSVLDVLASDLRGHIWVSCSTAAEEGGVKSDLQALATQPGVILFSAAATSTRKASPSRVVASSNPPQEAAPTPTEMTLLPIESEDETQPEETGNPAWPSLNETEPAETVATPKATVDLQGVRALYAFQPESAPFKGLSPNQIATRLKELGFNAVFGGSSSAPVRRALQIAGIKRFAEIPLFVGEKHWERDPECQPVARSGRKVKKQGWYAPVCPNTEWLQKDKLETILRLIREQEVDGIWLDFVRYPVFWEEVPPFLVDTCFCPVCLSRFEKKTGLHPEGSTTQEKADWILTQHTEEWYRFRADSILEYVQTVANEVRKAKPGVVVGAFLIPWREDEHEQALYHIAGQDPKGFAGIVDVLSPMLYFHELGRPATWVSERVSELNRGVSVPILPIVQCFDLPDAIPTGDLQTALAQGLAAPSKGIILFSQKHLESTHRWELIQAVLKQ